jgi:xylitol oxidase
MDAVARNWAGNVTFGATRWHRPTNLAHLQGLVADSRRLRAIGTAHSFSRIADTDGELVCLGGMPAILDIDSAESTIEVSAGLRYSQLARHLHASGYALANLGSLPQISVGGACATGTHGSGTAHGSLATAVVGADLVIADGSLIRLSQAADPDRFTGAVVGLGALGIVTSLRLAIEPAFDMQQHVYLRLPWQQLMANSLAILDAAYSVSVFIDWTRDSVNQVWLKHRIVDATWQPPHHWFGGTLADHPVHPVAGMPAAHCTPQLGVPGPWYTRLPHFRADFTPSAGDELQSEYFIPRESLGEALAALESIAHRIAPVLYIGELRTVAADDLWLSPSYGRDTATIHFTWHPDLTAVRPVLDLVEQRLAPYGARPHWGKIFVNGVGSLDALYDRMGDFRALAATCDPHRKFANEFLDRHVYPEPLGQ